MKRVAIFLSGGGSNMVALLDDMARSGHAGMPCVVLANSADAGGLERARERGVPTVAVDHRPFKGDRTALRRQSQRRLNPMRPI